MTQKELLALISQGESQAIEFKARPNPEIGRSIVAFANTNDGNVIVGVSDDKKIQGCSQKDEPSIANIAHDCKPSIYPEIEKFEIEGRLIFAVTVKKSGSGVDYAHKNTVYRRVGTCDKPMSPGEVVSFARNSGLIPFDSAICENASSDDLDEEKIELYLRKREEMRKVTRPEKLSHADILLNLHAAQRAQSPQGLLPTNAGILFFSKNPGRFFVQAKLRLVRFKGVKLTHPVLDRLDCSGTLWEIVEDAEDFIRKTIRLLGYRTEKSFMREDKFEYPIRALREAIINALIHRNYFEPADTRIFIFDDRIEVINPGAFPEGVSPRHPAHRPVNRILCDLMYDIGFIEKFGSGIHMMKQLCKEWGNELPYYRLKKFETTLIFESPIKGSTMIEANGEDLVKALNPRQVAILEYIQNNKKISTVECIKLFPDTSERTIRNDLKDLEARSLLGKRGHTKGTFYYGNVE
jgi:ATP-dependent DNA helicase RecG